MKIVWALHARQCFSMFPKCTQTKNIWQNVVSQLIKVFLPGTEKHLVNCSVSVPTAVFHPPPSTEFKPEHKYTSKTCSFWNTRKSCLGSLFSTLSYLVSWKNWWRVGWVQLHCVSNTFGKSGMYFFPKHLKSEEATPAQCTQRIRERKAYI